MEVNDLFKIQGGYQMSEVLSVCCKLGMDCNVKVCHPVKAFETTDLLFEEVKGPEPGVHKKL